MTYGALTFDTQTVMSNSFDFNGGLLNQLKKLRHDTTQVIITETVRSEILQHLTENTQQAISTLEGVLKKAALYGLMDTPLPPDLKGRDQPRKIAQRRLREYLSDLNASTISSAGVDLPTIMKMYFSRQPPFSKGKKDEFPDAVSLLTLEDWAFKNHTRILAISGDADWKEFAEKSGYIDVVETVNGALDKLNDQLHSVRLFAGGVLDEIEKNPTGPCGIEFKTELRSALEGLEVASEGASYHQIESAESARLDLESFKLLDIASFDLLEGGDDDDAVVVAVNAELAVVAQSTFYLSTYDGVDRDYVSLGGFDSEIRTTVDVQLMVTIYRDRENPSIGHVEITDAPSSIDFGEVEPDFRNDYWDDEDEEEPGDEPPALAVKDSETLPF